MREKTCCFTGHREFYEDTESIRENLTRELKKLIEQGVIYFGAGGALGFDMLAAETVLELKSLYPQIKLILVLPCEDQAKGWSADNAARYERLKMQADKVRVLSPKYYRGCMLVRNRHLVDHAGVCLCYKRKESGGTAYTVNYAKKQGIPVIEI